MSTSLPLTYYFYLPRFLGKLVQNVFSSALITGFFAFVAGKFLDQFTLLEIPKTFLFLGTFLPLIIYLCIKDFRYWPRKIFIDNKLIQTTDLLGKSTIVHRENIVVYQFDHHILVIGDTQKQIHLNAKSWADHDHVLLTHVLSKWVPRQALPVEIQEVLAWHDTHPEELAKNLESSITVETAPREIRNVRITVIFMVLIVALLIFSTILARPNRASEVFLPFAIMLFIAGLFFAIVWYSFRPMLLTIDDQGIFTQKGRKTTEWYWKDLEVILFYWYSSNRYLAGWQEGKKQTINLMLFDQEDRKQITNTLAKQTLAHDIPFAARIL